MEVYQIGSSIDNPAEANDLDLLIVSDKPIDICLYTPAQWSDFIKNKGSAEGRRIVIHPLKHKGNKLKKMVKLL